MTQNAPMERTRRFRLLSPSVIGLLIATLVGSACAGTTQVAAGSGAAVAPAATAHSAGGEIPRYAGSREQAPEMVGMYIMGYKVAMAAFHGKAAYPNFPRDEYYQIASVFALQIGVQLPPLPAASGDGQRDAMNARAYLFDTVSPLVGGALVSRPYAAEVVAIFKLGLYDALAVRFYSPAVEDARTLLVSQVPELARTAKLPELIWAPPVKLVEQQRAVPEVREAFAAVEGLVMNYYGFAPHASQEEPTSPPSGKGSATGEAHAVAHGLAYVMGIQLGLATAMTLNPSAKVRAGAGEQFAEAQQCAQQFSLSLPPLPRYSAHLATDTAAAMKYLYVETGPRISKALDAKDESRVTSAHFELGELLPMAAAFYDPKDGEQELAGTLTTAIQAAAERTGLPVRIWGEPVSLLKKRAPTAEVTRSLEQVERAVLKHYGF